MVELPPDIIERLRTDFGERDVELRAADLIAAHSSDRIRRCIVVVANGNWKRFDEMCTLAAIDWRDVITAAEYDRHDRRLFDFNQPIPDAAVSNDDAGTS
ncbi:MAG: hypothetical protein AAF432_06270 [Planctomycetota bacterium]